MPKLTFNSENCTGCRACELACSFHHEELFSPTKSRIRVVKIDEEGIDVPVGCEQCESAPCILICPVSAIYEDKTTQAVILNPNICIGCKQCLAVCPFGAIHYNEEKKQFYKCDLCNGEPECIKWCETKAITYTDELDSLPRTRRTRRAEKTARALSETRMGKLR